MQEVLQQAVAANPKPWLNVEIKTLQAQNRSLYPEASLQDWFTQVHAQGFHRHVVLHRRNGLRRLVSHLMAQRSGVYVQTAGAQGSERAPLMIDTAAIREGAETHDLIGWLQIYERSHQQLCDALQAWCEQQNLPKPLHLHFEDVIESDPQMGYRQVCTWLDLPEEPVSLRLKRINPEPLSELIGNWDAIEQLLVGTPYAWMLAA